MPGSPVLSRAAWGKLAIALFTAVLFAVPAIPAYADESTAPAAASTKRTAEQELKSADYLLGTWSCKHVVGDFSGTYKTTWSKPIGGQWLKQTYDFPAGQAGDKSPAVSAETLMTYVEPRQEWVRFFANSLGQYFAIRMSDTSNGWQWRYVGFFTARPVPTEPDATFTKKSDKEYTIDGPSYDLNGTHVTEHHSCQKL